MPELSLDQAAAKVGSSPNSVRQWAKTDPKLKKAVKRKGNRAIFDDAALRVLADVKAERYKAASPALRAAWAARAAGKGKGKAAAKPKTKKTASKKQPKATSPANAAPAKPTTKKRRSKAMPIKAKSAAAPAPSSLEALLAVLRQTIEKSTQEAQDKLRTAVRSVLLQQRDLIDRALKELG